MRSSPARRPTRTRWPSERGVAGRWGGASAGLPSVAASLLDQPPYVQPATQFSWAPHLLLLFPRLLRLAVPLSMTSICGFLVRSSFGFVVGDVFLFSNLDMK